MGRRSTRETPEEAESKLTSMLDLIFNILAYFVVTFNPPKPEKNFDIALPPPQIEKQEQQTKSEKEVSLPDEEEEILEDVTIALGAGPNGSLASVRLEGRQIQASQLSSQLQLTAGAIGGATGDRLEAATIVASPKLKYRYLIEVIDSCYKAGIKKIFFAEAPSALSGGAGGGADAPPP
ncbi:Biopolymer transport protein ExbD/TolR [Planctomycetes bacterium Pan216]|uniref:Biopolymer transport protein ExbD/TolR n=1 Tax=Kolteria novifilia TaxID=2527975 RepID=A0A518AY94_9BACT|nr:Biopolymer transport protein ExbD/TolR [Planctomycetes bacterium Pan216]